MDQIQTKLTIGGTTCEACEKIISKRVGKINGVLQVTVNAKTGETIINADRQIQKQEVAEALAGTHYSV